MRMKELFQLVVELRAGGSDEQDIRPDDVQPRPEETAELLQRSVDYAFWITVFAGLCIGISSVMALTAGDGTKPINVLYLISVTMILPLLGVLLTVVLGIRMQRGKLLRGPLVELGMASLRGGVWLASRALERGNPATQLRIKAAYGVFRGDYEMLQPVVPWLVRRVILTFSFALSGGFIIALVIRLTGIDLTFGWQSTGDFLQRHLPQVTHVLSYPFAWISEDLVPSSTLISETRFRRFSGDYVGGPGAAALSWQWVPFLITGAIFWGVILRVFLLLWFLRQQEKAIEGVLHQWDPVRRLQGRMGGVEIARPERERHELASTALEKSAKSAEDAGQAAKALSRRSVPADEAPVEAVLLIWENDVPPPQAVLDTLCARLNATIVEQFAYGVRPADDEATLHTLKTRATKLIFMHVEPFSPPGAGFVRQFRALREAVGPHTPVVIELGWWENGQRQSVPPRTLEVWQQSLQQLSDRAIRWHISDDDAENARAQIQAETALVPEPSPSKAGEMGTETKGAKGEER